MHILLLDLGKEMRGGQWQVFYLARALARSQEFTVTLAAPANAPLLTHAAEVEGVTIIPLSSASDWDVRNIYKLRRAVKKHGAQVIHTNCAKSASLGAIIKKMCGDAFRLIHTRRVSYPLKTGWSGKKYLLADAVVGVSQEISDTMLESAPELDSKKVFTIHSGIDSSRYQAKKDRNDERMIIGMIGALTEQKGHVVLVRALGELIKYKDLPTWEARFVGDGPLFGEIKELAEELEVSSHIALLGRQDARDQLPYFDLLAVPSVNGEGSSGVIKEGWVGQLPVVASDLESNLELVEDQKSGLTFPNHDHEKLAQLLHDLMLDEKLRANLVEGGNKRVQLFTDMKMATAYMELYKQSW
ncbi:glycosyltransferase family 4 protein [Halodesulfovibrio marinisediminis]|uniref:Glycosyltransferase involved in cell wall bisynthesis n=1 Tax=Halodesulfovibrio marinisediminis DSM 17456 TaxID=1121457 RepID=A0A1N6J5Q2_9BACT|nr:glycosyltransferase family 4 protein [Halodesulfovibrio marinisediminis]SIO39446.1 Glycosyltransferase involved in cell wall bisynthesis [Halodesulfovibrio marinisediminis DSM 17456]